MRFYDTQKTALSIKIIKSAKKKRNSDFLKEILAFLEISGQPISGQWSLSITKAYSGCFMHATLARMRLPFFKIFSNFVHFCPNFTIFCPFSEKSHLCPFFLQQALIPPGNTKKHHKTSGFLIFSGGIEGDKQNEMGLKSCFSVFSYIPAVFVLRFSVIKL